MRYDLHIHHRQTDTTGKDLLAKLNAAGFDGGIVLSQSPVPLWEDRIRTPRERIDNLLKYVDGCETLVPFYFLDPTDEDAAEQVDMAVAAGMRGFKIICTHFFPDDPRAVPIYHRIAKADKPILFHSGILYDGTNASGNYNRPCNFEVLLGVPRLRFALAHISWPWCNECIAVYGKFANYLECSDDPDAPEMFVDITPGTPAPYRRDALSKLLFMDGAAKHVLWGSDNTTRDYRPEYSLSIRNRDESIFPDLNLGEEFMDDLYYNNLMRFLNGSK